MKFVIISLLLSFVFLLPAAGFAQQPSDDPVTVQVQTPAQSQQTLHLTKPARRTVAFQSTLSAVKEFCGKHKDNASCKSDSTEYDAASKLIEKSPELQAYIETGVLPDKPIKLGSLPAPYKLEADTSGKSGMNAGLNYQQRESSGNPVQQATPLRQVSMLELNCEDLAKAVLRSVDPKLDVEFPGRGDWESDLCRNRELWHQQYLRWEAHKGTSTETGEYNLTAQAWSILQGTALEGTAMARLYLDKTNR